MKVCALAGGVGGAKLANGFARLLPPGDLSVIVNTGDDFTDSGLYICPDLDTVTYTLAGLNDPVQGWGRREETWHVMKEREAFAFPAWFKLGDKDLALHLERTRLYSEGYSLTKICQYITQKMKILHSILPMTDSKVRTTVNTREMGRLSFQEYFVKYKYQPSVISIEFEGIDSANISEEVEKVINQSDFVVICPSNPFVSIYPILSIPGMETLLYKKTIIAVSPIIGGKAVKGPAAKMFHELGMSPSSSNVAKYYRGLINGFILDNSDRSDTTVIGQWGIISMVTDTLMTNINKQISLAKVVIEMARNIQGTKA